MQYSLGDQKIYLAAIYLVSSFNNLQQLISLQHYKLKKNWILIRSIPTSSSRFSCTRSWGAPLGRSCTCSCALTIQSEPLTCLSNNTSLYLLSFFSLSVKLPSNNHMYIWYIEQQDIQHRSQKIFFPFNQIADEEQYQLETRHIVCLFCVCVKDEFHICFDQIYPNLHSNTT